MSGENGDAGRSAASGATSPSVGEKRPASAWAPLGFAMFRALWIAQFASNVGTWMQTVGAQWLLIDRSPLLVSLVQTASTLPIVLLALPAGAWADLMDRRRLLLGAQAAMFLAAAALAVSTFLGGSSPALVLGLTFVLGCGNGGAGAKVPGIGSERRRRTFRRCSTIARRMIGRWIAGRLRANHAASFDAEVGGGAIDGPVIRTGGAARGAQRPRGAGRAARCP